MKTIKKKRDFFPILFIMLLFTGALNLQACAQSKNDRPSPPKTTTGTIDGVTITIDYSSPAVKGRTVWGDLVAYNEVWRTGANEATIINFDKDVVINGQALPAGKYSLFTIPAKDKWTFIFNKVWDQWGSYNYDEKEDALRVNAVPEFVDETAERLDFRIENEMVNLYWEKVKVGFKVENK